MGKTTDVISAAGTAYPSGAPEFIFMFYMLWFVHVFFSVYHGFVIFY